MDFRRVTSSCSRRFSLILSPDPGFWRHRFQSFTPIAVLVLLLGFTLLENAAIAETQALTVAVLDFESKEDAIRDVGAKFSAVVAAYLSGSSKVLLVERADLMTILREQEQGISGAITSESAARIGHLTGAKILVSGKVLRIGTDYLVVAKIMGSETGRVFAETVRGKASDAYTTMAEQLSRKLIAAIESGADQWVAPVTTNQDYAKILLEKLGNKYRPRVSIQLPEQHYGSPVNDPAAETEISLLLIKAGFQVVDWAHSSDADIRISGEAFSAFAGRKGNLVSCRARVEVKAVDRQGKVIFVDRETVVYIDSTEQTAAKGALQRAAAQVSLRLLPSLVESEPTKTR